MIQRISYLQIILVWEGTVQYKKLESSRSGAL